MGRNHRLGTSLLLSGLSITLLPTLSWNRNTYPTWVITEAKAEAASGKVTAPQLLLKMRRSLVFIADKAKKLTPEERAHIVPFFKALKTTARDLQSLDAATKAHATKDYAKALLATSESIGRLDATYDLANSKDKAIGAAMRLLGDDWRDFLRHYGGGSGGTVDTAKDNARRIAALREHLLRLAKKREAHASEKRQIAAMIAKLDRAARLNRSKGNQWLTLALMSNVTGWYGGYYDYYLVYYPNIASFYKNGYRYFQEVSAKSETAFEQYYSSYSWTSYESSIEIKETQNSSTDSTVVAEEKAVETAAEGIDEAALESVDSKVAEATADSPAAAQEFESIDKAEAAAEEAPAEDFQDPADVADEEAEAEAVKEIPDEEADADYAQAEAADTAEMAAEEPAGVADDPSPEPAEQAEDD